MTAASQPEEGAILKFEFMIRIPLYVHRLVRRNEAGFIGLAVAAGCIAGLCVVALLLAQTSCTTGSTGRGI